MKTSKRKSTLLLLGIFLSLLTQPLLGDSLRLRDGKKINGFFLEQDQKGVLFETLEGREQFISLQNIKSLTIGFPGVAGCYWLRATKKKICNIIIRGIGKKKLLFFSDKEGKKLKKVRLNTIRRVDISRKTKSQQITPILRKKQRIKIWTKKQSIEGKVRNSDTFAVQVISQKGKEKNIYDREIQKLYFFSDPSVYKKYIYFSPYMFLPGGAQFSRKQYWKGSFFAIGTIVFIGLAGWQGSAVLKLRETIQNTRVNLGEERVFVKKTRYKS